MPERYGILDVNCPINWDHPTNRGLIHEMAVSPNSGWRGGNTFRDLVRGGRSPHDGTLTNGPTWTGIRGRPGGFGALSVVLASNQYATSALVTTAITKFSTAVWFRWNGVSTLDNVFTFNGSVGTVGWGFIRREATGIANVLAEGIALSAFASSTYVLASGVWNHLCMTRDATTNTLYVNGQPHTTSTTNFGTITTGVTNMGAEGASSRSAGGLVDSHLIWSRCLSPAAVQALYQESCLGNPERWNWVEPRRRYSSAVTARRPIISGNDYSGVFGSSIIRAA